MKYLAKPSNLFKMLLIALFLGLISAALWQHSAPGVAWAMDAPPPTPVAPSASTSQYTCTIARIEVYAGYVGLECTQPVPGTAIWYFGIASDGASSAQANRMLAAMTTAFSLGKQVIVYYTDNTAVNPPGCPSTCRRLDALEIQP